MRQTEFVAGLTTFATMAYIIILNPQILSASGMEFNAVMVATILVSMLSTLMMGLYGQYPFAIAPGMGLNAYFTYGIVMTSGFTWQAALAICFIAGAIVLLLNLLHLRETVLHAIPRTLRLAGTCGIGLFLIFIALKNLAIVVPHPETLVSLGNLARPEVLLTAIGLIIVAAMLAMRINWGILIGILFISFFSWIFGYADFKGIVSLPPSISSTFMQLDFAGALQPAAWPIIATIVFVAMFDTTGTLMALSEQAGFLNHGRLPRARRALSCDPIGTMAGAVLGTSPATVYLESASGIAVGGRTGWTAIYVVLFLAISLLFSPLIASIPIFATVPALLVVGAFMMEAATKIDWTDTAESIPAAIVVAAIPLTYSIADGIGLGFVAYPCIKLLCGRVKETHPLLWLIAGFFTLKFMFL